jgi:short-subunit dehydrogenase
VIHPFPGRRALITGASAGLGEEFAMQLAERGARHLVLTARRVDRLKELQARIFAKHPTHQVEMIPADLATEEGLAHLISSLVSRDFSADVLINNAGLGDLGTFETSDSQKNRFNVAGQYCRPNRHDSLGRAWHVEDEGRLDL